MNVTSNTKIMILYASYGDGHYQAAKALREKFIENGVRDIIMIDLFKEASPTVNAITRYFYIKSYKVMPAVYGWLYYGTKHIRWDSFLAKRIQSYGVQTLKGIIEEERPDMVIHTFPMSVMPEICRKTGYSIPSVTVVTDFDLHRRWLHPGIDKFYVATEDLKEKIAKAGIPRDHIYVSGIPVKPAFEEQADAARILRKYRLKEAKHRVLIMAGSYGVMQGLKGMCERLSSLKDVQMIVVCGKNNALKKEMDDQFAFMDNVKILGFVDQIHELMHISTCIVTKPGGITLSEAIMRELPILIYKPVPGQERDNALYLASKGAAHIANDPKELESQIMQLLAGKGRLNSMQRALRTIKKPHAADAIVQDILAELARRSDLAADRV